MEQGLIHHSLPHDPFKPSEMDYLSLNVTTPAGDDDASGHPVLLFLHGVSLRSQTYGLGVISRVSSGVGPSETTCHYIWC
jgi:hypothetical protein